MIVTKLTSSPISSRFSNEHTSTPKHSLQGIASGALLISRNFRRRCAVDEAPANEYPSQLGNPHSSHPTRPSQRKHPTLRWAAAIAATMDYLRRLIAQYSGYEQPPPLLQPEPLQVPQQPASSPKQARARLQWENPLIRPQRDYRPAAPPPSPQAHRNQHHRRHSHSLHKTQEPR